MPAYQMRKREQAWAPVLTDTWLGINVAGTEVLSVENSLSAVLCETLLAVC